MKMKYAMCVLAVALMGEARGQQGLVCSYCEFVPVGGTSIIRSVDQGGGFATILSGPGEFSGDIKLTGPGRFIITGTGDYQLSGCITGDGGFCIDALQAGASGLEAGITFSGDRANSYKGGTIIHNGYLTCFKSDGVEAISGGNLHCSGRYGVAAHLWFRSNNQINPTVKIDFNEAQFDSYVHLNGTTQNIGELLGRGIGVVENNGSDTYFPAGMTGAQMSTNPATLNVFGDNTISVSQFTCGQIRNGGIANSPALTLNFRGGFPYILNFGQNVHDVTLSTDVCLKFEGPPAVDGTLGANVIFKGSGTFEKYGVGTFYTNNSTFLVSGRFNVNGVFRNGGLNNQYTLGTETNKATIDIGPRSSFDLYGNTVIIDGLLGNGSVLNNFASTSEPGGGYSWLIIGQNDSRGDPVFTGQILDNLSGAPVVSNGGFGMGGVALRKVGNGIQVFTGNNTYTGPTEVASGTLKFQDAARRLGGRYLCR